MQQCSQTILTAKLLVFSFVMSDKFVYSAIFAFLFIFFKSVLIYLFRICLCLKDVFAYISDTTRVASTSFYYLRQINLLFFYVNNIYRKWKFNRLQR